MLVPYDQSGLNQPNSTTPIPPARTAAAQARTVALQTAVQRAQEAADTLLVSNPWEVWQGGMNAMKDVQRSNAKFVPSTAGQPVTLPGIAGMSGYRSNWSSRFVTGKAGHYVTWPPAGPGSNAGAIARTVARPKRAGVGEWTASIEQPGFVPGGLDACDPGYADVVSSDGSDVSDVPPPGPDLRTDQSDNPVIVPPPNMGMNPPAGVPWWLWALAGVVVLSVVSGNEGGERRRGEKRSA